MRQFDVAIVGGGLAGSVTAAMLGRAGIGTALIEPNRVHPFDFRSEKLDDVQLRLLRRTGLHEAVLQATTPTEELWIARYGRLVEKRRNPQYGIFYDTLVHAVRAQVPASVAAIEAKATAIATGPEQQTVTLSNGEKIEARLVVMCTGLNHALRQSLGIERIELSKSHSVSLGFMVHPAGHAAFPFPALTYFGEGPAQRSAYFTVFPIGDKLRSNMFVYREPRAPWLERLKQYPQDAIFAALPGLRRFTGDLEIEDLRIRPVDLYRVQGCHRPGVVLIGDAFGTSCPAAGTGINKVLTDAERLCNVYVPRWLATPGMSAEKIGSFYQDPVKRACDAASLAKAFYLRSLYTETGLAWRSRRAAKFIGQLAGTSLRRTLTEPLARRLGRGAGAGYRERGYVEA
jgi:2-polyprenyl-6-methoxyphenol hydroxylase-like FAD-dependent oxidoreductase